MEDLNFVILMIRGQDSTGGFLLTFNLNAEEG